MTDTVRSHLENTFIIDGCTLPLNTFVKALLEQDTEFRLSDECWTNILYASSQLQKHLNNGERVYGLNTPCGNLDFQDIQEHKTDSAQLELLRSHACGLGDPLPVSIVRGMMLGRLHVFAAGLSGVSIEVVQLLLEMLNRKITPLVPSRGSVGASDLTSLAHIGLTLVGEGHCLINDRVTPAAEALQHASLSPVSLSGRDGLALINGLEQSKSEGAFLITHVHSLLERSCVIAALSIVASGCNLGFIHENVIPYMSSEEERASATALSALLDGHVPRNEHWRGSLSLRCAPQLFGAHIRAYEHARQSVQETLSAAIDNPLLLPDGSFVNNTGYMHGQGLGERFDALSTTMISLAVGSERRLAQLVNPPEALDLPPFLAAAQPQSAQHGLMIGQYSAASTIALLRSMAIPSSIQSMPTSGTLEDHVPMCLQAIHRADDIVALVEEVLAIELLVACYAIHISQAEVPEALNPVYLYVHEVVFEQSPQLPIHQQIQELLEFLRSPESHWITAYDASNATPAL